MRLSTLALPFALALAVTAAAGCKSEPANPGLAPTAAAATPPRASGPAAARSLIAAGAALIDVRTPEEHAEGHLPNDALIPVQELGQRMAEIEQLVGGDKTKPVVVYCRSGARAGRAKGMLEAAGFTNVVNGGGYDDLR